MMNVSPAAGIGRTDCTGASNAARSSDWEASATTWISVPPVNSMPGFTGEPVTKNHPAMTRSAMTRTTSGPAMSWRFGYRS